jgi:imidazolonepropionase-like amidohydrolase
MADEMIRVGGNQIESARNAGITTALSVPRSGIWMGQSALINLAGETPQQMTVRSPIAMHVGFAPLRGTYPGSLMGVFSALRQMLFDAQAYREAKVVYERSPRGVKRPTPDRSLEALLPVLDGKLPVVFHADRERDIRRALDLAEEFRLKAVIAGGTEAWKVTDRLGQADVPVLLSLNFPRRTTAAMAQADPEPLRVLRERVEAPKTAAKLAAAKVRFAFQSGAMSNITDFLPNAGKTIENGLLKDEAIRALTARPAEIFGLSDRLGTIETGKIANLTVVRGDLFDRNSRIAQVFIDGIPVELRPAAARPAQSTRSDTAVAATIAGTWNLIITLNQDTIPGTLVLNQEGSNVTGTITTTLASSQFSNGTSQGNTFRASFSADLQGQSMELTIDGRVSGNEMSGTIGGPFGVANFTGTRPR